MVPNIPKGKIWHKNNVLYQFVDETEFGFELSEASKESINTKYGKMMNQGQFADENDQFIMERTEKAKYSFGFKLNGNTYGVWVDNSIGRVFIDTKYNPTVKLMYSFTNEDHSENTLMTKGAHLPKWLGNQFKLGNVRFVNKKIRAKAMEGIKMVI